MVNNVSFLFKLLQGSLNNQNFEDFSDSIYLFIKIQKDDDYENLILELYKILLDNNLKLKKINSRNPNDEEKFFLYNLKKNLEESFENLITKIYNRQYDDKLMETFDKMDRDDANERWDILEKKKDKILLALFNN